MKATTKIALLNQVVNTTCNNGQIFTVVFEKKDGTMRTMNCRRGVKKHLAGGKSTIKHKPNLLSVYDMQAKGYRCINLETVVSIKTAGGLVEFS